MFNVVTNRKIDFQGLPNVEAYSGVSDATLAQLYRSADILFLSLVHSTANNTLLEGIASGLPVVATDLEAVRAYLPNGEGILVVENQVDAFVDALRRLQQDVELRHDMGRRARARAEELAWRCSVRQYEMLYTDVAVGR
jgi:glycosyltransferase involved in cell wall biosynthesis